MPVEERPIVPEVGETRKGAGIVLMVFFITGVFLVPVAQLVWELSSGEKVQELDIFRRVPTLDRIQRFENALSENAIVANLVRPYVQLVQLSVIDQGNEKVVIGRDGWLFYRVGLTYVTGPAFRSCYMLEEVEAEHPDPLPAILDFHRQLSELGIELVIVPVPVKPQIYPDKLTCLYDLSQGPPKNCYEEEFIRLIEEKGVEVINLTDVLWEARQQGDLLYMPMDTHWTPEGLSVFVKALAGELKQRHSWLAVPEKQFTTRPLQVTNKGDIYDMLDLPEETDVYPDQTITVQQVVDEDTGELYEPDETAPVVLLGDSFANVFSAEAMNWGHHAGLGEHLAMQLGREIDVIAVNGGAPTVTRRTLARRGNLKGKKLIIWEFTTRELVDPASEWEPVELPTAGPSAAAGPLEIKGKIIAVSSPPRPGEDPYAHCVTYTKYKVLSVESGEYEDDELLTVEWVMRDFKLLPSAEYQVGDVHHLLLAPYSKKIHPDLKQAKEVDDTADYVHQPFWVKEIREP